MINKLRKKLNSDIHLREILTGSAVTFVFKISGMLLGYLVVLIISRKYGAEGVGVYSLTLSILTFFSIIAMMGMNISILRYVGQFNKTREEYKLKLLYKYALELIIPFSLIIGILLYFFAEMIALKIFDNPVYIPALKFIAFLVPLMSLQNISVEYIRGLKKLKISEFLRSVNRPLINIILLIIISLFINDTLLPIYTLGAGIMASAMYAVYFITNYIKNIKPNKITNLNKKELVKTSMPMMMTAIIAFVLGNISLYMLEIYSTTEEVGLFSVVLKLSLLISLALEVVNTISAPKFSELYWTKKYDELQNIIMHSSKLIFFSSISIAVVMILLSNFILQLFGNDFKMVSNVLLILIIGQMVNASTGSVGVFLNMTGHQHIVRNVVFIIMLLSIFLNFLLVPSYGMIGAALATMIGSVLLNIILVLYVKMKLGYKTYYIPFK